MSHRRRIPLFLVAACFVFVAAPAQAAFPGKNGKIAFSYEGATLSVYTMNPDGTNNTALTSGADPAWSPDGTKIVFSRNVDCCRNSEIYVMDADGGNQT